MSKKLATLKRMIEENTLINDVTINTNDTDLLLDSRESSIFEDEWLRVFRNLEALKKNGGITEEDALSIKGIKEAAFKKCYQYNGSDVASYISDDFELFALAIATEYKDSWLNSLWQEYINNRFPHGKLEPVDIMLDKDEIGFS